MCDKAFLAAQDTVPMCETSDKPGSSKATLQKQDTIPFGMSADKIYAKCGEKKGVAEGIEKTLLQEDIHVVKKSTLGTIQTFPLRHKTKSSKDLNVSFSEEEPSVLVIDIHSDSEESKT